MTLTSPSRRGVGEGGDTGRGSRRAGGTGERYNDLPAQPGPEASPHPVPPIPSTEPAAAQLHLEGLAQGGLHLLPATV